MVSHFDREERVGKCRNEEGIMKVHFTFCTIDVMILNGLHHMIDLNVYITYMLGKVVPQPENQLGYPHFKLTSKSDPMTEGSAFQAEPKSDSYPGLGGTGPNN